MCASCHGNHQNRVSKVAMSTRTNKRRIYAMFDRRFGGKPFWRSAEEQAWLDVAPVGREFGSPDYERLQILDMYEAGQLTTLDTALQTPPKPNPPHGGAAMPA